DPLWYPIRIIGDVDICPTCTLSLTGSDVEIAANSDYCSAGLDTTKTELVVNGVLRLNHIDLDLFPETSSFDAWQGIRVGTTGHVILNEVNVKNAYCGIQIDGTALDTIRYCLFDSCEVYGIRSTNPNVLVPDNSIYSINHGHGIHGQDSITLHRTTFGQHGQCIVKVYLNLTALYARY